MESWWGWATAAVAILAALYIEQKRAAPSQAREIEDLPVEQMEEAPAGEEQAQPPVHHVVLEDVEDDDMGIPENRAAQALAEAQAAEEPQKMNKWKTREVGKKKAKSLARKEQRRQWFEYVRERAGEEREREQLEREMFGDLIAAEQEERQQRIEEAQAAIEHRRKQQRAREEELKEQREQRRAQLQAELARSGRAALTSDEDLLLATDLGHIVSGGDYVVTINDDLISKIAASIEGRTDFSDIANSIST